MCYKGYAEGAEGIKCVKCVINGENKNCENVECVDGIKCEKLVKPQYETVLQSLLAARVYLECT